MPKTANPRRKFPSHEKPAKVEADNIFKLILFSLQILFDIILHHIAILAHFVYHKIITISALSTSPTATTCSSTEAPSEMPFNRSPRLGVKSGSPLPQRLSNPDLTADEFNLDRYLNAMHLTTIENISSKALSRKLLILDLDETLIHTSTRSTLFTPYPPKKISPWFRLEVSFSTHPIPVLYYVYQRPHVLKFLQVVSQWFDLAVYTASVRQYADTVIDVLEKEAGIRISPELRFFREHCVPHSAGRRVSSADLPGLRNRSEVSHIDDNPYIAPGTAFNNYFSKNVALVARKWLAVRKAKRMWGRSTRRRRSAISTLRQESFSTVPSSSELSSDFDEDEVDRALAKTILLDNSLNSFALQPANGFPALEWINDPSDEGLLDLLPVLDALRFVVDVRSVLGLRVFDEIFSRESL